MASVQSQPIFWRDLAPSPEWLAQRKAYKNKHGHTLDYETPNAYAERRLREAVWKRLVDQYRIRHGLKPTEREIEEFLVHYRQARAKNAQAEPNQQAPEEERFFAEWYLDHWKLQQSLYRRYGGRVIYQQVGPEAIDAMRDWLKEKEADGQLVINDAELREQFWEPYLREDPGVFIPDPERVFEHSWSAFEVDDETAVMKQPDYQRDPLQSLRDVGRLVVDFPASLQQGIVNPGTSETER